jgi:hypothetical protein
MTGKKGSREAGVGKCNKRTRNRVAKQGGDERVEA